MQGLLDLLCLPPAGEPSRLAPAFVTSKADYIDLNIALDDAICRTRLTTIDMLMFMQVRSQSQVLDSCQAAKEMEPNLPLTLFGVESLGRICRGKTDSPHI